MLMELVPDQHVGAVILRMRDFRSMSSAATTISTLYYLHGPLCIHYFPVGFMSLRSVMLHWYFVHQFVILLNDVLCRTIS